MRMLGIGRIGLGALAAISLGMHSAFPFLPRLVSGSRPYGKKSGGRRSRSRGAHPANNTGWWRARAEITPPPEITERMLARHGWYRRQKKAAHAKL